MTQVTPALTPQGPPHLGKRVDPSLSQLDRAGSVSSEETISSSPWLGSEVTSKRESPSWTAQPTLLLAATARPESRVWRQARHPEGRRGAKPRILGRSSAGPSTSVVWGPEKHSRSPSQGLIALPLPGGPADAESHPTPSLASVTRQMALSSIKKSVSLDLLPTLS